MITTSNRATTLNIILLQTELLITLNVINSPFHKNFHPSHHRRCQGDPQDFTRGNSTTPTASTFIPTQTEMSSQDSSADGGMHLSSSFGAIEYHGISSYQWATLLLLVIIVVWLNLRYRRKSRIASDAKRGILPPLALQQASEHGTRISGCKSAASSAIKGTNEQCSCARSTSTGGGPSARSTQQTPLGPDIGTGPWIAHAMIKNQTTRRKKAKGNCWDNRICGKPITDSSDEEELNTSSSQSSSRQQAGFRSKKGDKQTQEETGNRILHDRHHVHPGGSDQEVMELEIQAVGGAGPHNAPSQHRNH